MFILLCPVYHRALSLHCSCLSPPVPSCCPRLLVLILFCGNFSMVWSNFLCEPLFVPSNSIPHVVWTSAFRLNLSWWHSVSSLPLSLPQKLLSPFGINLAETLGIQNNGWIELNMQQGLFWLVRILLPIFWDFKAFYVPHSCQQKSPELEPKSSLYFQNYLHISQLLMLAYCCISKIWAWTDPTLNTQNLSQPLRWTNMPCSYMCCLQELHA